MTSFLAMGGYAGFVWPAYGIALAVLAGLVADSIVAHRRARGELARLERERATR